MSANAEPTDTKSLHKRLEEYIQIYLASDNKRDELEVRFGTHYSNPLTRIDFENAIAKLKSLGFTSSDSYGAYHLNIQNQYTDAKTGKTGMGNIRTEIRGLKNIQNYCKSNTFNFEKVPSWVWFNQKYTKMVGQRRLLPIDYHDFQFRVNFKTERFLKSEYDIVQTLLGNWEKKKKTFRLIKRFTFRHPDFPVKVDCSIVRSSSRRGRYLIPEFRVETSKLFHNPISYELEIEVDPNHKIPDNMDQQLLITKLKTVIKFIMAGIQETNFPISYKEQSQVLHNYMNVLHKGKWDSRNITSKDFVGPSSISLERVNIAPLSEDSKLPNIRMPYTVTEKADGIRKLLYIDKGGRVYLIDVNMRVQFTGLHARQTSVSQTILDGEHVLHDKEGSFINQYLVFDIYYEHAKDIRPLPFYSPETSTNNFRLVKLNKLLSTIHFEAFTGSDELPLHIFAKKFAYSASVPQIGEKQPMSKIFDNCKTILDQEKAGLFEYEVDGLIFTPADKGVGSNTVGEHVSPRKKTWPWSMKWKPEAFNTIDFLVTTQKTEGGEDVIKNIFEDGDNMHVEKQLTQYKVLILRVGFSEQMHGYLNPCADVIQDKLPHKQQGQQTHDYKPVPFYPVDPTPAYPAYLAHILLEDIGGMKHMLIENKQEEFEDGMIVEFRYDKTRDKFWQWIPIRVRLDKTAEYRSGRRNYGNAYHVAQSVWRSIHNPITPDMLRTGKDIPDVLVDDDVYYNRKTKGRITKALRDFHNLFVKRTLILGVSKKGDTLIDMSVGKAGDFPKWIAAHLSFVFGLDISRDNIENRLDGACARFLNYRKRFHSIPYALFVNANSALHIRSGEACFSDTGKKITKAIFGMGPRDEKTLGKGVIRQYGKGEGGFDVVSNQFSLHYFFENAQILNRFLRNISECCKVGGYFIGTSYDGRRVFQKLEKKKIGESIFVMHKKQKIWEIKKQYSQTTFDNNVSSLGYKIDVYQESINKVFSEYLVNYTYFTQLLENYGFTLATREEVKEMGIPSALGNFNELYTLMEQQMKSNHIRKSNLRDAFNMTPDERNISNLNKYFIYKKVRDVNAEKVSHVLMNESQQQVEQNIKQEKDLDASLQQSVIKISKQKRKVKLGKKRSIKVKTISDMDVSSEIPIQAVPGAMTEISKKRNKKGNDS